MVAQFWGPFRYALCQESLDFLYTPLCHKMRVKTKHQNENFLFSYRWTISPPPVYALWWYVLCLFITPLCYGLRFKNDSSWRNTSHLPIAQNRGGKTKHLLKNLHFLQKVGAGFLLWAATFLTPLSHKMGVKTEMLFENFSKIFLVSKNAGSERITHSLPAEDLALLTLVISVWQS